MRVALAIAVLCLALSACGPALVYGPSEPHSPAPGSSPAATPAPATVPGEEVTAPRPPGPARPAPRVAHVRTLGPASQGLIRQAHVQAAAGQLALAAATLERALRIEPDHPQIWLELGRVRQTQHNYAQAETMGRKALAAADDRPTQAAAWRLIAESLRSQSRVREATEAADKARSLDGSS